MRRTYQAIVPGRSQTVWIADEWTRYRIYGVPDGYRVEYELPTGWWPVGKYGRFCEARAAMNAHIATRPIRPMVSERL